MRQLKISAQITARESVAFTKYLQEVGNIPLLTREEELTLPEKIKNGDQKAKDRFVNGNLRFVISVAKQYQGSAGKEHLDDLVNAGNMGLIEAVERFDTTLGFKFISYAVWWIRQSIMEYLAETSRSIRLPANKVGLINKVKTMTSQLEQKLSRTPTSDEIAIALSEKYDALTMEEDDIQDILNIGIPVSSLDALMGEDSETSLLDFIESGGFEDIEKAIKNKDVVIVLEKLLKQKLSEREQEVLIQSFGLFGNKIKTLEEISGDLKLSRERIRQIRIIAIRKLKHTSATKKVKEYM